jgi:hypothetical protein
MPCAEELPLFASRRTLPLADAPCSASITHRSPRHTDHFASARAALLAVAVVGLCCVAVLSHRNASLRISFLEEENGSAKHVVAPPSSASASHALASKPVLTIQQQIAEGNKEMKELEAKFDQVREQQKSVQLKSHNVLVDKSGQEELAAAPHADSYLKSMDHRTSMAVAATSDAVSSALSADQLAAKKALKAAILAEKFKLRAQQKEQHDMEIVQRAREREVEDQKEERKAEIARKIADRVAAVQRAKAAKDVVSHLKSILDADIAKTRKDKANEEQAERAALAAQHTADMLSATDNNVVRAHRKAAHEEAHKSHHASLRHKSVDAFDEVRGSDRHSHTIAAAPRKHCDPLSGWSETLC